MADPLEQVRVDIAELSRAELEAKLLVMGMGLKMAGRDLNAIREWAEREAKIHEDGGNGCLEGCAETVLSILDGEKR